MANPFRGIGRALANRNYRIYWFGQIPHVQGLWMHRVAAGWLIFEMTHSPAWLGAIGFAMYAPSLVLSPLAGALSDRIGHRRMSLLSTVAGAVCVIATAACTYAGIMTPLLLFFLVSAFAIAVAFEFPARQTLVPVLLGREALTEGMALNWAVFNVAFFTGPLIAGLLLAVGGAGLAFGTACVTYMWMIGALLRLPDVDDVRRATAGLAGLFGDMASGLRYTLSHAAIPAIIGSQLVVSLLVRPYVDLMPGFAAAVFDRGESGLATLLAASGIGALAISIALTLFGRERWLMHVLIGGSALSGAAVVAFAATDQFWLGAAILLLVGGGATASGIANATLIQHHVEPAFRGRVVSLNMACQMGAPAPGALALGWLAEYAGLQPAIAVGGAAAVVLVILLGRRLARARG